MHHSGYPEGIPRNGKARVCLLKVSLNWVRSRCSRGGRHVEVAEEVLYKPADTIDNGIDIGVGDIIRG